DATRLRAEFAKVKDALITLEQQPDDAEANTAVGKYYCISKGDWTKGLPYLARSSDNALRTLAAKEIKRPNTPETERQVADGWFALATTQSDVGKLNVHARAQYWYALAVSGLNGLRKTHVERRLAEIDKEATKAFDVNEPLISLRQVARTKNHRK